MEEKVLIKSQHYDAKKPKKICITIGVIIAVICLLVAVASMALNGISAMADYKADELTATTHKLDGKCTYEDSWDRNVSKGGPCRACRVAAEYSNPTDYAMSNLLSGAAEGVPIFIAVIIIPVLALVGSIIAKSLTSYELTVTDKRIYGSLKRGKRVDLPLDSISAVGIGAFRSITVSTASGRIAFSHIKNRNEIHQIVSKLLVERQTQPTPSVTTSVPTAVPTPATSNADELKKYKELLDMGVISQEEFDAKKKQLLGL